MIYFEMFKVWLSVLGGILFQESYSAGWDKKLNELMDAGVEVDMSYHTVILGGIEIWTSNRWYSYAHAYGKEFPRARPSIKTMIRFSKYVDEKVYK
jgi:hypothetical protein